MILISRRYQSTCIGARLFLLSTSSYGAISTPISLTFHDFLTINTLPYTQLLDVSPSRIPSNYSISHLIHCRSTLLSAACPSPKRKARFSQSTPTRPLTRPPPLLDLLHNQTHRSNDRHPEKRSPPSNQKSSKASPARPRNPTATRKAKPPRNRARLA